MPKQAQRSLEIYDREGEEAMIAYLMFANRNPDNTDAVGHVRHLRDARPQYGKTHRRCRPR